MRKFVAIMATILSLNTVGFATGTSTQIDITNIAVDKRTVSIETVNGLQEDTIFTITVVKDDADLDFKQKVYFNDQQKVKAGETVVFEVIIPDDKDGVSGAGEYIVTLANKARNEVVKTFKYIDKNTINEFFEELKTAAEGITEPDKAYEVLLPLFAEDVFFNIGVDYKQFSVYNAGVQNETINLLYATGVSSLNAETFPEIFKEALALSVYNNVDKIKGLEILSLDYDGGATDKSLYEKTTDLMVSTYQTTDEFKSAFRNFYGLVSINNANVSNINDLLDAYKSETNKCKEIINKINALSGTRKITAYEYIVLSLNSNKVQTSGELETLLEKAHIEATKNQSNGALGGGGTGGSGSRTPVTSGSVSTTVGSGGTDTKDEETFIFPDLSVNHWAAESVDYLKNAGIISGNGMGLFEPDRYVAREEFAKMLVLSCGIDMVGYDTDFGDAKEGAWYRPYIGAAVEYGIVNGIGDNEFGVGLTITRQDMAVMTARALKVISTELSTAREYTPFADERDIAEYAIENVILLYEAGVINGKGSNMFEPNGYATRAEAAKIIYELIRGGSE